MTNVTFIFGDNLVSCTGNDNTCTVTSTGMIDDNFGTENIILFLYIVNLITFITMYCTNRWFTNTSIINNYNGNVCNTRII